MGSMDNEKHFEHEVGGELEYDSSKLTRKNNPTAFDLAKDFIKMNREFEKDVKFGNGAILFIATAIFPLFAIANLGAAFFDLTSASQIYAGLFILSYPSAFVAGKTFEKHLMPIINAWIRRP